MEDFSIIYQRAAELKGEDELRQSLPTPASSRDLQAMTDSVFLEEMTKCIFRSGFVWRIVEAKWPGFQEAFLQFNPRVVAHFSDEKLEQLAGDPAIIRHHKKIVATRDNAAFVLDIAAEHGSFGKFLADWPNTDLVGLHAFLKKNGSRLGGHTGQYFLRFVGKDTFLFTKDVVTVLVKQGIVEKEPTSKVGLAAVQDAFNQWHSECGLPYSQMSRIIAASLG